jgi:predicted N-acetyltransferase YhbS
MSNSQCDIIVRFATVADLSDMLEVEQNAFPKGRWASRETLELRLELFSLGCFIAVINAKVVGFCNGFPIGDLLTQVQLDPEDGELFLKDGENWLLRNVAVFPDFQRRGVGGQLVNSQIEAAIKNGSKYIRFTATPNLDNFYSGLGFVKTREAEIFHGVPQALWQKQLK